MTIPGDNWLGTSDVARERRIHRLQNGCECCCFAMISRRYDLRLWSFWRKSSFITLRFMPFQSKTFTYLVRSNGTVHRTHGTYRQPNGISMGEQMQRLYISSSSWDCTSPIFITYLSAVFNCSRKSFRWEFTQASLFPWYAGFWDTSLESRLIRTIAYHPIKHFNDFIEPLLSRSRCGFIVKSLLGVQSAIENSAE